MASPTSNPFRRNIAFQRGLNIPVEFLEPEEVGRVFPDVDLKLDDVAAAVYCAIDGVSDPAGVTEGFRKGASRLGVSICTDQEVVGIDVEAGRVSGVRTPDGYVSAPFVVNAAGPYAAMIGRMVDVDVPVEPIRHFVFVTRPFEGAPSRHTLVIEFSSGWCFHREGDGILMAMGNRAAPPTFEVGVDWDFFETVMEKAIRRYPAVEDSAILKSWAGAYETTPDHNPILGRVAGMDGFILANGFSGHGFMHSPATGQLIAEVIPRWRSHLDRHIPPFHRPLRERRADHRAPRDLRSPRRREERRSTAETNVLLSASIRVRAIRCCRRG